MRRAARVAGLGALVAMAACDLADPAVERLPTGGDVTVNVVACDLDPATGLATATFELTAEEEYSSLLLHGELSDQSDVVIGTGTGSVTGVQPGKTYRDDIRFTLTGEPQGQVTCDVRVELANPGL